MKHPNLVSISLAKISIPTFSTSKCLYKYAKAIMNYICVQDINKLNYTLKEVLFMYLNHLDSEARATTQNNLWTVLETAPDPILIKYRVPEFATTITYMIRSTHVNEAYINMITDIYEEQYEDKSDTVINVATYQGCPPPNNRNQGKDNSRIGIRNSTLNQHTTKLHSKKLLLLHPRWPSRWQVLFSYESRTMYGLLSQKI